MLKPLSSKIFHLIPHNKIQLDLNNKLLLSSIPYYLLSLITLLTYFYIQTHAFLLIFIIYALFPILDEVVTIDWRNPNDQEKLILQNNNILFQLALYVSVVLDWLLFFKVMMIFSHYQLTFFNLLNLIALVFIYSTISSGQFAIAHQIFHKQGYINKIIGTIQITKLLYTHFTYEHLYGHHKRVATPLDPASAQKNTNLYNFVIKSFIGSYKSVYKMQKQLNRPIFLNISVLSIICSIIFTLLIWRIYGNQGVILFVISSYLAIIILQTINYIQHYGLRRQLLPNGQYQKVTIRHSWNSPYRISNYFLFKVQRHSDHHENSLKPYQILLSLEDSPQLTHGYTLCLLMSFCPNVWFKVINPLLEEYQLLKTGNINGQIRNKANLLTQEFILQVTLVIIGLAGVNYTFINIGNQLN